MIFSAAFVLTFTFNYVLSSESTVVAVDVSLPLVGPLKHFWDSTGLCPPEPRSEAYKFLLSDDELRNLAIIAALPHDAIIHVRIHWLLDMITVRSIDQDGTPNYNFTHLDKLLDTLHDHGLVPGFELMGNPSQMFTDFDNETQLFHWKELIRETAERYIVRYGDEYVARWRFETWNEPDLKGYNIFNFTLPSFLRYFHACAAGLHEASRRLRLGGPAGLFKSPTKHPLCWGLLEYCANATRLPLCPLDFISYHKKGGGTGTAIIQEGLQLVQDIMNRFPSLGSIPLANDEADPLTGWSKSVTWRADVTYGALVGRVIIDHQREFVTRRGLPLEVLSNDNSFLNYHPYYFTQRTLLARFQMNNTSPPHLQFFRKPVYTTMALLAYLGTNEMNISSNNSDERLSVLAASNGQTTGGDWDAAVVLTYSNETLSDSHVTSDITVTIDNLPPTDSCCKYVVYRLSNAVTNPSSVWRRTGESAFPDRDARRRIRAAEGPERVMNIQDSIGGRLDVVVKLTLPTVVLVHVCTKPQYPPGPITHLKAYNVTTNEVLLVWRDDHVITPCIKTYEVEFLPRDSANEISWRFRRVNADDVIFLSYQYVAPMKNHVSLTDATDADYAIGTYRVRGVDYWDRPGPYLTITYPLKQNRK